MAKARVLIFGAYGNGNLGDTIQAECLEHAIARVRPDVEVFAASHLQVNPDYPFEAVRKLRPKEIMDPTVVNKFDLLIIGGGGLLAWPHVPLAKVEWVRALKIPTVLWGIGADETFAPQAAELIARADFVSGRCTVSIKTLEAFTAKVHYVCDPVLADYSIALRKLEPDTQNADTGTCWVLRGPRTELHDEIAYHVGLEDRLICFEESIDGELRMLFPEMQTIYSVSDFISAAGTRRIVSMRYHGLVLGALLDLPIFSLNRDKGARLLEMLGLSSCASDVLPPLLASLPQDTKRTTSIIQWHSTLHDLKLAQVLNTFL